MAQVSDTRGTVLDTLALVDKERAAQFDVCAALRAELTAAEERLARLASLHASLMESLPDLGVSPEQPREEHHPGDTALQPEPPHPPTSGETEEDGRPTLLERFWTSWRLRTGLCALVMSPKGS